MGNNYNPDSFYYKDFKLSKKKVAIAIAALVAIIFLIIYLMMSVYFQGHFMFGTKINGINVGGKTPADVETLLKKDTRYYVLKLIERDNVVEHISAEDISLYITLDESVSDYLNAQNPYGWLFSKDKEYTITSHVTYDETMLINRINTLKCTNPENMRKPSNPTLVYNDVYTVKPGDAGTELDVEKLTAAVKDAVNNGSESLNLDAAGCYLYANVDETSKLYELEERLNSYLLTTITLEFGNDTEVINKDLISTWISLDENTEVVFDRDAIISYLGTLAKKYETFGCNRTFVTATGQTVLVKGGDYGWWFDKSAEAANIISDIKNTNTCSRPVAYRQEAAEHGDLDIGTTYCEISLSKQKLYLIVKGEKVLETDIISGTKNSKYATPVGTYRLRYKMKNYTFNRVNFTKSVAYWMVFYGSTTDDTVGLMDAQWLNKFGGDVYKSYGSFGSIYMTKEAATTIYNKLPTNSPILIYE